jgi:alkaline phosphatase
MSDQETGNRLPRFCKGIDVSPGPVNPMEMRLDPHPPAMKQPASLKLARRSFLQTTAATVGGLGLGSSVVSARPLRGVPTVAPTARAGRARNVIFMVSDGMSFGTLTMGEMFCRQHRNRESYWFQAMQRRGARRGLYATHAANSLVTDSAASASAWGCGVSINNSCVNVAPDGKQLLPVLVQAAQSGKATGVATTTRVTHATPAGFIANCPYRDWEGPIARQIMERRIDVALGGGAQFFGERVMEGHESTRVLKSREELLKGEPGTGRLLGLFSAQHLPFELDRPETVPTLAEMTRSAMAKLKDAPDGFVLQIEGGRVDHAAHNNDAAALIAEQVAFDEAIGEVLKFIDDGGRDDTLLIVTSDHGNANPGLTLYGENATVGFARLAQARRSFEWLVDQITITKPKDRPEVLPRLVMEASGVELNAEERDIALGALSGVRKAAFLPLAKFTSVLGGLLANVYGVSFVSGNHTADRVEVTALGPGSEDLSPIGHNRDLHGLVVASLGLGEGKLLPDMLEPMRMPKVTTDE